jgi:hypothetical protein
MLAWPQEWIKNSLLLAGEEKVLSLVTLILIQKLFVPVSPRRLEKNPPCVVSNTSEGVKKLKDLCADEKSA